MKDLFNLKIGIGTWAWGDRLIWSYGNAYSMTDIREAFQTSLDLGLTFFDTAEVYGRGLSEKMLGTFIEENQQNHDILIASKFMPFPWRLSKTSLLRALENSLKRLNLQKLFLYQIHMPLPPISIRTWMDALADVYHNGLIENIGVSNFDAEQTKIAYERLKFHGIRLASNQVEYNLINRNIEKNGVKETCDDLNIRVIAYSPLAMGILTGKYSSDAPPSGPRSRKYPPRRLGKIQPLLKVIKKIGNAYGGKSPSQIALNWLISKGVLPIPGAKNQTQVILNTGALDWHLKESELAELDEVSNGIYLD